MRPTAFLAFLAIASGSILCDCERRPPRSPAELANELHSGDSDDREDSAKDLRRYPNAPPDALPHVFAALQAERDPKVYGELLVTLGYWGIPEAQPYIEGSLGHHDDDVRDAGKKALRL